MSKTTTPSPRTHVRPKLYCGPGRTKSEFKDESDVNQILKRFQRRGLVDHLAKGTPIYGDFTGVTDYQTAIQQVKDAEAAFLNLPSNIRRRFNNSPGELVMFLDDPDNLEEAIELGLAPGKKRASPAAQAEPPVEAGEAPAGDSATQTS